MATIEEKITEIQNKIKNGEQYIATQAHRAAHAQTVAHKISFMRLGIDEYEQIQRLEETKMWLEEFLDNEKGV